jgi:hypothetical protein
MAVTTDILQTWRSPARVIRAKLDGGAREDRALATLFGACFLLFVAQWPALSRASFLDPSVPLDARIGGALMGAIFLLPLLAYAVAGVARLVARALGGKGTGLGARMALFWAMLAVSPVVLFHGLLRGFVGEGVQATVVGLLVLAAFLYLWLAMMIEAER